MGFTLLLGSEPRESGPWTRGSFSGPPPSLNSAAISSALQDTVSVHRPGFYAERFQRFMCNTVFKKIPCKWLLPDEPPVAPFKRWGAGHFCQGTAKARGLLLFPHSMIAAACLYVSHSVCSSRFQVARCFPPGSPYMCHWGEGHFFGNWRDFKKYVVWV